MSSLSQYLGSSGKTIEGLTADISVLESGGATVVEIASVDFISVLFASSLGMSKVAASSVAMANVLSTALGRSQLSSMILTIQREMFTNQVAVNATLASSIMMGDIATSASAPYNSMRLAVYGSSVFMNTVILNTSVLKVLAGSTLTHTSSNTPEVIAAIDSNITAGVIWMAEHAGVNSSLFATLTALTADATAMALIAADSVSNASILRIPTLLAAVNSSTVARQAFATAGVADPAILTQILGNTALSTAIAGDAAALAILAGDATARTVIYNHVAMTAIIDASTAATITWVLTPAGVSTTGITTLSQIVESIPTLTALSNTPDALTAMRKSPAMLTALLSSTHRTTASATTTIVGWVSPNPGTETRVHTGHSLFINMTGAPVDTNSGFYLGGVYSYYSTLSNIQDSPVTLGYRFYSPVPVNTLTFNYIILA